MFFISLFFFFFFLFLQPIKSSSWIEIARINSNFSASLLWTTSSFDLALPISQATGVFFHCPGDINVRMRKVLARPRSCSECVLQLWNWSCFLWMQECFGLPSRCVNSSIGEKISLDTLLTSKGKWSLPFPHPLYVMSCSCLTYL